MDAPSPSQFRRSISQQLVNNLVHVRGPEEPANDGQQPLNEYQQVRRQTTTELNRRQFTENQQVAASQMMVGLMMSNAVLISVVVLLVMSFVLYGALLWFQGVSVYNHDRKPCDQPLSWWLLVMLVGVAIQQLVCLGRGNECMKVCVACGGLCIRVALVAVGFILQAQCETCADTNPTLYNFVKRYLVFNCIFLAVRVFTSFAAVGLVIWMVSNGIIAPAGPGPHMAGREGLINELETVPFESARFSDGVTESDMQPPECCICAEEFNSTKTIKATPCGHFFHEECLGVWLGQWGKTCPLCREDLDEAVGSSSKA